MGVPWAGSRANALRMSLAVSEVPAVSPGEQEEALCRSHISQLRDIRLQLESCESRTVTKVRLPLGKEPARECAQRQSEQQVPGHLGREHGCQKQGPGHPGSGHGY